MDHKSPSRRLPTVSPTRPLHIRKESSQHHVANSANIHLCHNPDSSRRRTRAESNTLDFPPRSSSLRKTGQRKGEGFHHHLDDTTDDPGAVATERSTLRVKERYRANSSGEEDSSVASHSTVSSIKLHYLSDFSSPILGDFIKLGAAKAVKIMDIADQSELVRGHTNALARLGQITQSDNPYEFEPITPKISNLRQTAITDFIKPKNTQRPESSPAGLTSPQFAHFKNARSDGNTIPIVYRPNPYNVPTCQRLTRSGSSPNLVGEGFVSRDAGPQHTDISTYAGGFPRAYSPRRRGRHISENNGSFDYDEQYKERQSRSISRQAHREPESSPTRQSSVRTARSHGKDTLSSSTGYSRHLNRSPPKGLRDVEEREEVEDPLTPTKKPQPKKRSRSPMKKMFGENGWLGKSPSELQSIRQFPTTTKRQDDSPGKQKKTGMLGKLRNKFDEMTEKADVTPRKDNRSFREKSTNMPNLSTSLGPPEQARTFMELELMLSHTANSFLMSQFSQGRMSVDTIKKTVEGWKSKGRPTVIEFMYDQATQRDLVAANHQHFRFYGPRAGDDIRVASMLYNWRQVAGQLAIRTFCSADTVILKLLFDIEQILELLGAAEPIMLRVQQIRVRVRELMEEVRNKREGRASSQMYPESQQKARDSESSSITRSRSGSGPTDDPYSGLKLVPDNYREPM
ncbi:hypothetical protein BGZ60DRAFT_524098 [Tricladium varicosporioides]|nr:hypothetical protein BGZ60DRAFT_524098 [Hymenoscyphus varicosporioides]